MERLKGKTILVGKEPGQGRLLVSVQGKTTAIGSPGCVPNCVSRCKPTENVAHAKISIDQNGNITLSNMKSQNVTFVNGSEIQSKRINQSNTVELGKDRFSVSVPMILETAKKIVGAVSPPPKVFNISHLSRVWDSYEKEMDRIAIAQQELGKKRMMPIMVSSGSGLLTILGGAIAVNTLWISVPITLVVIGLYMKNYKSRDTSYDERKKANEKFQDNYVCPNPECNKFFSAISYKLLKNQLRSHKDQKMYCPRCGCELVEK